MELEVLNGLASTNPAELLLVNAPVNATLFVDIELVTLPLYTIADEQTILVAGLVQLPKYVIVPPDSVIDPDAGALMVTVFAVAVAATVTTYAAALDAESKITSSILVGIPAPPVPPEVDDQFVFDALLHVPAPPIQ